MSNYQEDLDAVEGYLTEEMDVNVIFADDEPNAYWRNGHGTISVSTKQNKRLQLYSLLHEAGHAVLRQSEGYEQRFPYGPKPKNRSISRRVDVLREEVLAWDEGAKMAEMLGVELDQKLWHGFLKKHLFDYVRWAYDPESFNFDE